MTNVAFCCNIFTKFSIIFLSNLEGYKSVNVGNPKYSPSSAFCQQAECDIRCYCPWIQSLGLVESFKTHLFQSLTNPLWTFTDPALGTSWSSCHPKDSVVLGSPEWGQHPAASLPVAFPYVLNKMRAKRVTEELQSILLSQFS